MRVNHLKIFRGPEDAEAAGSAAACPAPAARVSEDRKRVTAPVSAVLPLLADAVLSQRTWLRDFEDEEVTLSADLYEVLMAYQHFRRPVA